METKGVLNLTKDVRLCFSETRADKDNRIPAWPIVIVTRDGEIYEASTVRGTVAAILGYEYLDCEDEADDYFMRVEHARREIMLSMMDDENVVIFDTEKGIIPDNFAGAPGEEDFKVDETNIDYKIYVDTERRFIFSLALYGSVKIMERDGSHLLRDWTDDGNDSSLAEEMRNVDYLEFDPETLEQLIQK